MIILIPLGGLGTRFKKFGYKLPKPLINVMGKPIIFWLLDNLNLDNIDYVVIPYNLEINKYRFSHVLKKQYPNINFIFIKLKSNTRGAAETIYITLEQMKIDDMPILCLDGDNFYIDDIISKWKGDNCIYVFQDSSDTEAYSYIQLKDKKIIDIIEKKKISDLASTGGYGFNSWHKLRDYCKKIIDNNIMQKNEFYTSTVIREMLKDNYEFIPKYVNEEQYICLGTPFHVRLFCNNFPRINAITNNNMLPSKRYCFDLDNTLVTFPKISNDYSSVEPIHKNIIFLKYLKKLGHTIIIYTARRMKTHKSNVGKIMADIGRITFDTLEKFDIPYDEIYFGKPNADFYIDDLAISSYEDLEKELGYYVSNIDPRDFNTVTSSIIQTFKKSSNDLSGEIYYYENIPIEIKDMFPILIRRDIDNKWYEMEKINGIPVSKLYLSEELTESQLGHIMNSIHRIHSCKIPHNNNINIYKNYIDKLEKRYNDYDYSSFSESNDMFIYLKNQLSEYIKKDKGQISVIQGDTVMTNIVMNNFGKIKLIDMRGKMGDILTIYGDRFYDYAKLYQSLVGYDEILEDKYVNSIYKNHMLNFFEKKFIEIYDKKYLEYVKIITKSLLFTLIPLHNNSKSVKYFDLIYIF